MCGITMDILNGPQTLASITFSSGPLAGKSYPLKRPVITLGRDPGNDIVVSEPSVSRHHARMTFQEGVWTISKVQLQNRLTINQRDVQEAQLQHRDTIGLGSGTTTFVFQLQQIQPVRQQPIPPHASIPAATQDSDALSTLASDSLPDEGVQQGPMVLKSPSAPYEPQRPTFEARAPQAQPPQAGLRRSPDSPPPLEAALAQPSMPTVEALHSLSPTPVMQDAGPSGTQHEIYRGTAPHGVPTLEVSNNTNRARQVHELTKPLINIGRAPNNDIVIDMPTVSGYHAQIVREGNQLIFVHPHPSRGQTLNGIIYNGRTIAGNEQFRKTLARGDVFRISDEHGTYVTLTYNDGSGAAQDVVPDIRPIMLGAPSLTLGRMPDNTVVLNHPQVSAHHARLERVQNGYRIVDLNSTNHVYVNARAVTNQALKPGDEIRIGPFKLTYTGTQLTQYDESNSIRIDALHLKREGNKHVVLINDISLAIPPRKFVAIVGGSGAGKSTLMNALNGLRPADQGKVLYNGQDYYTHLAAFSTQLGYVPQDDIIHRDLTVERALYFAAKLRLPDDFTEKQIKLRIEEVLEDVEMKSKRSSLVSKLSGGQRKRVSIALELLANPSVFFLDEPTSGLDPGLDRKMMLLLRKLADKGHTIVLVTHATNNINNCDFVCFLCQGGRLAYYGPPDGAKAHFGKEDFAEIYSALEPTEENKDVPAQAEARFKQSEDYRRYIVEPLQQGPAGSANPNEQTLPARPAKTGNPWKQFRILSMRYLTLLLNDRVNLAILILQAPIIAVFLFLLTANASFSPTSVATCPRAPGSNCQFIVDQLKLTNAPNADQILDQNILPGSGFDAQKTLLFMAFAVVLLGCLNGVREIVKEEAIYRRERAVNLGIAPYMFSKIVIQGLLALIQCALIVLIVNAKTPFVHSTLFPPLIEIYITLALTALAGLMLGLTISAISPNADRAMSFVPLILVPEILFSGAIFTLDNPLFQFISWFFAVHWGIAGMGSTVGLHGDKLVNGDNFLYQGTLFTTVNGNPLPGAIAHLFLVWAVLIAMIVVLGFLTANFLKKKDIRTQR
jgi:ABC-type multidrug transport system ATPase subunit/pSer/pThr/pTyr-binding forkhead associated (FHA) protein/ABC-type multidrug transport system permease subunit